MQPMPPEQVDRVPFLSSLLGSPLTPPIPSPSLSAIPKVALRQPQNPQED